MLPPLRHTPLAVFPNCLPPVQEDWDFLQVQCAMYVNSEVPGLNPRTANVKAIRGSLSRSPAFSLSLSLSLVMPPSWRMRCRAALIGGSANQHKQGHAETRAA